jgi:hypothetical protein
VYFAVTIFTTDVFIFTVTIWAVYNGHHITWPILVGGASTLINCLYHWGLGYRICFPAFPGIISKKESNEKKKAGSHEQ